MRGNLGRGAKDLAAFGNVVFESVYADRLSTLTLKTDGTFTLDSDRTITKEERNRLGVKGTGTVVTVVVNENIRCPRHAKLAQKLARHFQLRDIMSDPQREVTLVDLNRDSAEQLRYVYPTLEVVHSGTVQLPGYPGATANLTVFRNAECYDEPQSDPARPAGLLIKGRRAIYENSLFKFENNPYAGWFSGRIECSHIDQLAREYDERLSQGRAQEPSNPTPLITRSRDGLQRAHPFYRALAAAVEPVLADLIKTEEERAKTHAKSESVRMRRILDALGRDLSRLN